MFEICGMELGVVLNCSNKSGAAKMHRAGIPKRENLAHFNLRENVS